MTDTATLTSPTLWSRIKTCLAKTNTDARYSLTVKSRQSDGSVHTSVCHPDLSLVPTMLDQVWNRLGGLRVHDDEASDALSTLWSKSTQWSGNFASRRKDPEIETALDVISKKIPSEAALQGTLHGPLYGLEVMKLLPAIEYCLTADGGDARTPSQISQMQQVSDGRLSIGSTLAMSVGSAVLPALLTAVDWNSMGPVGKIVGACGAAYRLVEQAPTAWNAVSDISQRTAGAARSALHKISQGLAEAFGNGEARHHVLDEDGQSSVSGEPEETQSTNATE